MRADLPGVFRIEAGVPQDVDLLLRLIKALAEYEQLPHEVTATTEQLRESLFGATPAAEVVVARVGAEPVGFALFFQTFSTFLGKPGLHLEDLFVVPEWRNRGFGKQLLAHVAQLAVLRDCGRLEWSVLDWNEPAIGFYRGLSARPMDDWTVFRLTGDALRAAASHARSSA